MMKKKRRFEKLFWIMVEAKPTERTELPPISVAGICCNYYIPADCFDTAYKCLLHEMQKDNILLVKVDESKEINIDSIIDFSQMDYCKEDFERALTNGTILRGPLWTWPCI